MSPNTVYDLSRLVTRVLNATPNGIDRIDMLLARHFLTHREFRTQALGLGFTRPRLLSKDSAIGAVERARAAWREDFHMQRGSPAYEAVVARLRGAAPSSEPTAGGRIVAARPERALNIAHGLMRHLPPRGRPPSKAVPHGAIYFNATHFPLEWPRHVAWLREREDVRPVFFIHDLLPIEAPQWFWGREPDRHLRRLELLARRGAAAVVASHSVEQSLRAFLARAGRADLPIFRASPPVDAIFFAPRQGDPRLAEIPFFLVCGTIEPRKNHLLLLRLWRELVEKRGPDAPKLVVIGKRGWNNREIIAALEDEALRGHVIEVTGLPTPDYKRLLDHCRALLAPSLAEGFGLPVAEALTVGTPVLASDIPPFREQDGSEIVYLNPLMEADWREAILARMSVPAAAQPRHSAASTAPSIWGSAFFVEFDAFLRNLML